MRKYKVIKCLDGKERIFSYTVEGEKVQYSIWKDGKPYGKGNVTGYKCNFPKFVTKEMIFGDNN